MTKCYFHRRQLNEESAKNVCDHRDAGKRILNKHKGGVSDRKQWQDRLEGAVLRRIALGVPYCRGIQLTEVADPISHTSSCSGSHVTGCRQEGISIFICVSLEYEQGMTR